MSSVGDLLCHYESRGMRIVCGTDLDREKLSPYLREELTFTSGTIDNFGGGHSRSLILGNLSSGSLAVRLSR